MTKWTVAVMLAGLGVYWACQALRPVLYIAEHPVAKSVRRAGGQVHWSSSSATEFPPRITAIDLAGSSIDDAAFHRIADDIRESDAVRVLYLSDTSLSDDCVSSIH